jgi:predicted PurR-regulated permease PerM
MDWQPRLRSRCSVCRMPRCGGAIIGSLALIPFLGYVGVIVLACQLAMKGAAALALLSFGVGVGLLLCGDKILRPMVARNKVSLPFVWFLMGCLGGFEVLGPVGLVVGPVVLTIARELWEQRAARLPPT